MKPALIVLGVIMVFSAGWWCGKQPVKAGRSQRIGRFEVRPVTGGLLRYDTTTGDTWLDSSDGWKLLPVVSNAVSDAPSD